MALPFVLSPVPARRPAVPGGLIAVLLLGACGGSSTGSGTGSAAGTIGSVAGPTAAAMGTASAELATTSGPTSGPASGPTLVVPITTTPGPEDQPYVTAQISVGGGAPATVWLDTGSSGLLINSSAVGPDVTTTTTAIGTEYTSGDLVGTLATAPVEIGGVATAQPIAFGLLNEQQSTFKTPAGTVGIMGIGTANDADLAQQQIFAPQVQLPPPYDQGSTLAVAAVGPGTWTLGPVAAAAAPAAGPLTAATGPTTGAPAGYPAFQRPVNLCWTIGSAASICGPTDLDTGSPSTILSQADYADLAPSGRLLPTPTPITVALPGGGQLWSFTSGSTYAQDTAGVGDIGGNRFNTGLGFFVGRTVAWDYDGGRLIVTPAG